MAPTRKLMIRACLSVIAVLVVLFVLNEINNSSKTKDDQIAKVRQFADDREWTPTGRWYVDSVGTVVGQVELGTCVMNVSGPAARSNELQVMLPDAQRDTTQKHQGFRAFLVARLTAGEAQANKWGYYVSHCFYSPANS